MQTQVPLFFLEEKLGFIQKMVLRFTKRIRRSGPFSRQMLFNFLLPEPSINSGQHLANTPLQFRDNGELRVSTFSFIPHLSLLSRFIFILFFPYNYQ
jgi:hypothetical protein